MAVFIGGGENNRRSKFGLTKKIIFYAACVHIVEACACGTEVHAFTLSTQAAKTIIFLVKLSLLRLLF